MLSSEWLGQALATSLERRPRPTHERTTLLRTKASSVANSSAAARSHRSSLVLTGAPAHSEAHVAHTRPSRRRARYSSCPATIAQVCKRLGISDQTFFRWRIKYGALKEDEAQRLKELEQENTRLKRIVAEHSPTGI